MSILIFIIPKVMEFDIKYFLTTQSQLILKLFDILTGKLYFYFLNLSEICIIFHKIYCGKSSSYSMLNSFEWSLFNWRIIFNPHKTAKN